jgi:ribosome-associated toxin RatA of RatAB toxin-antitoxin module
MTRISTNERLPYSPKQMYDLVNDTTSYPLYLPLCSHVQVHSKTAHSETATITLSKGKVKLQFTVINSMEEGKRIDMKLVEGPFKRLKAEWLFNPIGHRESEVSFDLEFEFSNPLLNAAFGGLFKSMVGSMVEAFSKQAVLRYGKPDH